MFEWVFVVAVLLNGELVALQTNYVKTEQQCVVMQNGLVEASVRLEQAKNPVQTAVGPCVKKGDA